MGAALRRVVGTATAMTVVVASLRALSGCTTTPDLDFAIEAVTLDGAGPDAAFETTTGDASDAGDGGPADRDATDARTGNTCPDAAPGNVALCCGRVRCVGKGCDVARCDECKVCAVSSVCCVKNNNTAADCVPNVNACK